MSHAYHTSQLRSACAVHGLYPNADRDRCDLPSIVGGVYVSAQFALTLCQLNAFLNQVVIGSAPFGHDLSHKFAVSSASERSVNRQTALWITGDREGVNHSS